LSGSHLFAKLVIFFYDALQTSPPKSRQRRYRRLNSGGIAEEKEAPSAATQARSQATSARAQIGRGRPGGQQGIAVAFEGAL
jgi:hypothetical protein